MPVRYDTDQQEFVVDSDDCPDCGEPLYQSGCDAPGCNGLACQDCGTGCDSHFVDTEDGAGAQPLPLRSPTRTTRSGSTPSGLRSDCRRSAVRREDG